MRKWSVLMLIGLLGTTTTAQTEQWQFQGYAIGADATGAAYADMGAMPDIVRINSVYYMYYVAKYGTANAIWYASSFDMINWTVEDTIMTASLDPANRIYNLGGPGVLKLDNGDYRLFYRTSQEVTFPDEPEFHVRSMISSDGIHFTHEGICIEVQPYQADSYFLSASHPAIYKDSNGDTRAFLTGRDSGMVITDQARLYTAFSPDEGLTWTDFTPIYEKCHDPVVIRDSSGLYHMYTSYLGSSHREVVSADGITWPAVADSLAMKQGTLLLDEMTSDFVIADLGAAVKTNGEIVLYSNYKPLGPGAWVDIAYFYFGGYSQVSESDALAQISIYPNPANDYLVVDVAQTESDDFYQLVDLNGRVVATGALKQPKTNVDLSGLESGSYFIRVRVADEVSVHKLTITR